MKKDFIIYFAVTVVTSLIALVITPLLSNYVTPAEFGVIGLFLAFTQLFALISGWSSNSLIVKSFHVRDDINHLVGSSMLLAVILSSILLVISFFIPNQFIKFLGVENKYITLSIVSAFLLIVSANFQSVFQMSKKAKSWAMIALIGALTSAILTLSFILIRDNVFEGRIFSLIFANVISALVGLILISRLMVLRFKPIKEHLKLFVFVGTPLFFTAICTWSQTYIDRFFISSMIGLKDAGIYVFAVMLSSPLLLLFTTYTRAWSPDAYEKLSQNHYSDYRKNLLLSLAGYLFVTVSFAFSAPYVYKFFVDESYHVALALIIWFSIVNFLIGVIGLLLPLIIHSGKEKSLAVISFFGIVFCICFYFFLIPLFGILGAIFSRAISMIFIIFMCVVMVRNPLLNKEVQIENN